MSFLHPRSSSLRITSKTMLFISISSLFLRWPSWFFCFVEQSHLLPHPMPSTRWMLCNGLLCHCSYFQINIVALFFLPDVSACSLLHPQPLFSAFVCPPALSPNHLSSASSFYPLPLFISVLFLYPVSPSLIFLQYSAS